MSGMDAAFSGHLSLHGNGQAAYLADGIQVVGRGRGCWTQEPSGKGGIELEIFQYPAASAEIPEQPLRFRGLWDDSAASPTGISEGEWYFCPAIGEPQLVGSFRASGEEDARAQPPPSTSLTRSALGMADRDSLIRRLERQSPRSKAGSLQDFSERFSIQGIDSVQYIPEWIDEETERAYMALADSGGAWENMTSRVSQEHGAGSTSLCGRGLVCEPLPEWLQEIADELHRLQIFDSGLWPMNSVRLNGYHPGQGIHPHCDGPVYYPRVAILSLGSPCLFSFYPKTGNENIMQWDKANDVPAGHRTGDQPLQSVLVEPRSLLVFDKDAFWHHRHGIAAVTADVLSPIVSNLKSSVAPGTSLPRSRRVSLTMRHLLPRCGWPCCDCAGSA